MRRCFDRFIADEVAVGIVNRFKIVDVQNNQKKCLCRAFDLLDLLMDDGNEHQAIIQARQSVEVGEIFHFDVRFVQKICQERDQARDDNGKDERINERVINDGLLHTLPIGNVGFVDKREG